MWIAAGLLARGHALAQESAATIRNPYTSDSDIAAGEKYYLTQCAACHGRDGRGGGAGPDISTGRFKRVTSDEGLFQIINRGIPGTVMPASPSNAAHVWRIAAYVRSLSIGRTNRAASGNASNGAKLFQSFGCAGCHRTTAPALDGIGSRRTLAEIRTSILDPQAEVPGSFSQIRAAMRSGMTVTGFVLNEDTFSIQIREAGGRLRSIERAEIASATYDRSSPMPAFRGRVKDAELDDLIAFLTSEGYR